MKIVECIGDKYNLSGMNKDELRCLGNIISSAVLVDKRNFTGVKKEIDQILK